MRNLAYPPWSHDEVLAKVRSRTGRILSRFEVRDINGNKVGDLNGIIRNEQGAQLVEINLDQTIKGTARYRMLPVDDLRRRALNLFVHAYHSVEMAPDRWAEWPMGVQVWVPPERSIWTNGVEEWQVAPFDITWLMELWDPGAKGFTVWEGTRLGTALRDLIHRHIGLPEWVSVPDIDVPVTRTLYWAPRTPREVQNVEDHIRWWTSQARPGPYDSFAEEVAAAYAFSRVIWLTELKSRHVVVEGRTTGLQIASELCAAVGFEPPLVGWDGSLQVRPTSDPSVAPPELAYGSAVDGLVMLPVSSRPDLTRFRNRVVVAPRVSTTESALVEGVADLNTIMPAHPFAQKNLAHGGRGFYIGETIVDDNAVSQEALNARARRELLGALVGYEEIAFSSMGNPAHEPYDPCSMQIDGDAEFGTAQQFQSRRLAWDLFDATVTHQHARTFPIAGGFES